mgnify:FL=1
MPEFRSGLKWEEWGERVFLELDEAGELLEGECSSPKYLPWKIDKVNEFWAQHMGPYDVAWCFKPRMQRFYYRTPIWIQIGENEGEGYKKTELNFEERLICGHRAECKGQEVLDV